MYLVCIGSWTIILSAFLDIVGGAKKRRRQTQKEPHERFKARTLGEFGDIVRIQ